ncbi:MAG: glycoside hydrolase family 88 protein [Melioribacteraceae bacterium]|nr:glycoside hydrolase family 88 protein [Melioribacteraceae bacterium]
MKKFSFLIMVALIVGCTTKKDEKIITKEFIETQLNFSVEQYKLMAEACPDSLFPRTFQNGRFVTSDSRWWCSGFYPGALVYLYEYSKDNTIEAEIYNKFEYLEKEKLNSSDHDIGFKINCSFGNMLRVTKDTIKYAPILKDAAISLLSRYNPDVGVIRSWGRWNKAWQYAVIIDNMMNLELLLVADKLEGNKEFYDCAISHADKTRENHYRKDNSTWHVVSYDSVTGIPHVKQTHQGQANESAWARGQAWGLYGYTVMYRETGEQKYLDQAIKVAEYMLNHKNVPDDLIFYWDYDAKDISNALRDASAAAITASALITLSEYAELKSDKYLTAAKEIIKNLSSPKYRAESGENGNFLLKHSVGSLPNNSEVDVPLSYADYYYVEALMKLYRKI